MFRQLSSKGGDRAALHRSISLETKLDPSQRRGAAALARTPGWQRQSLPRMLTSAARLFLRQKHDAGAVTGRGKQIALLGLFGCDNHGNDGSLEAMLGFLRRMLPEASLTSICVEPSKVSKDHGIAGVQINWPGFNSPVLEYIDRMARKIPRRAMNLIRTVRTVRQFDAVIVPGTGILSDYRADPFGAPYWVFRWCVAARLCGVKLYMVNIGAGPVEHPMSRWMLKQAARSASYRSYRDKFSYDFMSSLGVVTSGDRIYPDIVFTLPSEATSPRLHSPGQKATVGVGVMSYNGWQGQARSDRAIHDAYLSQLGHFVSWLLERGHPVRLLVGEITDDTVAEELLTAMRAAHGLTSDDSRLTAAPIGSLHDLMREIDRTDIVVASRFHNIVCALKLGRPTISISYTEKHDELMARAGLATFHQRIEELDAELLISQFRELADNHVMYQARVAECIAEFQKQARQQDEILLRSIR
jgi:polysaccharide pyruvyl transferase WcaK-like protein